MWPKLFVAGEIRFVRMLKAVLGLAKVWLTGHLFPECDS